MLKLFGDKQYYNASGQLTTMNGAGSIMLDVQPGDKIIANSFGDKLVNNTTSNMGFTRVLY